MPACRRSLSAHLVLTLAVSLAGVTLVAQQQGSAPSELPSIPVEQEPRHRVVFTNDFVRLIDATLPPFYVSERHSHAADNVAVIVQMAAQGQTRPGFASFAKGGYSHVITNPATTAMRFIDVELKNADRSPDLADPSELPGHEVVLSNARVRVSRLTLERGADFPDHQHANGYVTVVVRGREGVGTWKWHPSGEAPTTLSAGNLPLELVEIEPR